MNELIEALENLKKVILEDEKVVSFLEQKKVTLADKDLMSQISIYKKTFSSELKEKIEKTPSFLAYKEKETEVNLLILDFNQKFRKLRGDYDCRK